MLITALILISITKNLKKFCFGTIEIVLIKTKGLKDFLGLFVMIFKAFAA